MIVQIGSKTTGNYQRYDTDLLKKLPKKSQDPDYSLCFIPAGTYTTFSGRESVQAHDNWNVYDKGTQGYTWATERFPLPRDLTTDELETLQFDYLYKK